MKHYNEKMKIRKTELRNLKIFIKHKIFELLNSGFLFSFFYSEISEFCNSEVLFSLNAPTGLLKHSFGPNWVQKTKTSIYEISRMFFSNMNLNFADFANFNFAHFFAQSFG